MHQTDLSELQQRLRLFARERDWEQFHAPKNLASALIVEAGELLEHFQWLSEEDSRGLPPDKLDKVAFELADVFIFALRLADVLDVDLLDYADRKIAINEQKYPAERVRGSHRKYTEYTE